MIANRNVKVIAVSSGKGGVGKSNVCVNLAAGLVRLGKSVLLMDADLGMANIDILLGLKPRYDLQHVVKGERTLDEVIVDGPMGIKVVPASSGVGHMADLSQIEQANIVRAFDELSGNVDVLIVDTAAGISSSVTSFGKAAQELVVVVCDEPTSLTDAYALIKVLSQEHGVKRFKILANMVRDNDHGKRLFMKLLRTTENFLDVSIGFLGSIPRDEKLVEAVRQQAAVVEQFPHSASSIAFGNLSKNVDALPMASTNTGFLEFFVERTVLDMPMAAGSCK